MTSTRVVDSMLIVVAVALMVAVAMIGTTPRSTGWTASTARQTL